MRHQTVVPVFEPDVNRDDRWMNLESARQIHHGHGCWMVLYAARFPSCFRYEGFLRLVICFLLPRVFAFRFRLTERHVINEGAATVSV